MKITLEPTGRFQSVNGTRCRIWKGETDKGVPLEAFVALVVVHKDHHQGDFERELSEVKAERELVSFDYRLVI